MKSNKVFYEAAWFQALIGILFIVFVLASFYGVGVAVEALAIKYGAFPHHFQSCDRSGWERFNCVGGVYKDVSDIFSDWPLSVAYLVFGLICSFFGAVCAVLCFFMWVFLQFIYFEIMVGLGKSLIGFAQRAFKIGNVVKR